MESQLCARIVVADDNRDAAEALGVLLKLQGYEIRTAFDGIQAFEVADEFHPQVVILDIEMPGQDGYAVARLIRKRAWSQSACLIALTGADAMNARSLAAKAGFDRFVNKPVDPELFVKIVAEGLTSYPGGD